MESRFYISRADMRFYWIPLNWSPFGVQYTALAVRPRDPSSRPPPEI